VIQQEYFAQGDSFTLGDWRKVMDRVDEAMKSEKRAGWDF